MPLRTPEIARASALFQPPAGLSGRSGRAGSTAPVLITPWLRRRGATEGSKAAVRWQSVFCVLGLLAFSGCMTYDQQVSEVRAAYHAGNYGVAADLAAKRAEEACGGRDELIWALEAATLLRSAGRVDESACTFERADQCFENHAQRAKVRIGDEGLALVTNPAKLPYRGRAYDGIMISVYQALMALQRGDHEAARVYINRTYQRQQDAVSEHAAKIEKEQVRIKNDANVSRTMADPAFGTAVAGLESPTPGLSAYADYVNPFAVYLDGLYHWNAGVDPSDVQRAQKCFERVLAFGPDNPYVREDFERAMKATAPAQGEGPTCYILFETGMAPSRQAVRIDLPIIVSRVSYVGVSFPKLRLNDAYLKGLTVEAGGSRWQTERIASMDAIVGQDFRNELPSIIAHVTASAVTKAVAAYAINSAAKESGSGAQLASQLLTAGYQLAMNVADTRTWNTLPKEVQICKVPIPDGRRIALSVPGYGWRQELTLAEGRVVVVWAKAVDQPHQMTVSQFTVR